MQEILRQSIVSKPGWVILNVKDILEFFETESRLPVSSGERKQSKFAPNAWELSIIVALPDLQKPRS